MNLAPGAERVERSLERGLIDVACLEDDPLERDAGRKAAPLRRPLVGEVVLALARTHDGQPGLDPPRAQGVDAGGEAALPMARAAGRAPEQLPPSA